jgi:hypothetical protein
MDRSAKKEFRTAIKLLMVQTNRWFCSQDVTTLACQAWQRMGGGT